MNSQKSKSNISEDLRKEPEGPLPLGISRLRIADIYRGKLDPQSGMLELNGEKIWEVCVVGTVVQTFTSEDMSYGFLTLDDGTAVIRVRVWGADVQNQLNKIDLNDVAEVIGRIANFQGETYIRASIIRKRGKEGWRTLHEFETSLKYGKENEEKVLLKAKILDVLLSRGKVALPELTRLLNVKEVLVTEALAELIFDGVVQEENERYMLRGGE